MTVQLRVSVNGGAVQTGGITAAEGDSLQLSASSTSGWGANTGRFVIADYPPDFVEPAGWDTADDGTYFYQNANQNPPAIVVPSGGWGTLMLELTASDSGVSRTDKATAVTVPHPTLGVHNPARGEGEVFGGERERWVKRLKETTKVLTEAVVDLKSAVDVEVDDLVLPLVVVGNRRLTLESEHFDASGTCVLDPAPSGHVEGARAVVRAAAGLGNAIDLSPDWENDGPAYDPNYDWEFEVQRVGDHFKSFSKVLVDADVVAPTVVSVASDGTAAIVITLNKAATLAPTGAGLSISQTSGTPQTVTGVTAGNGTTQITVSLSGALSAALNPSLAFATNAIRNRSGVGAASGSATVAIDFTAPGELHDWDIADATHTATISLVPDGNATLPVADFAQATGGAQPTWTAADADFASQPSALFDVSGTRDYLESSPTSNDQASYAIYWCGKLTSSGTADQELISAATLTNDPNGGLHLAVTTSGGGTLYFNAGDTGANAGCSYVLPSPLTPMSVVAIVNATQRRLYVNGVLRSTQVDASNPEPLSRIVMARLNNADAWPGRHKVSRAKLAVGFTDAEITAGTAQAAVTAFHAFCHAKYGIAL